MSDSITGFSDRNETVAASVARAEGLRPARRDRPRSGAPVVPLPTTNARLPLTVGTFATLTEGLDYAARGETGITFFSARGEPQQALSYGELRERARDLAGRLAGCGWPRASRIALIAETSAEFVVAFFACQYAGLIPVPLPLSVNVGSHEAYARRLNGMLNSATPVAAMASADTAAVLGEAAAGTTVAEVGPYADFAALPATGAPRPFAADEPSYIQYSSGSTTEPRGVLITQAAITANARAIGRDGLALVAGDRATSWLPLYHDMGLVGFCITPLLAQISVDTIATATFAVRPRTWPTLISRYGGTISYSPTFGYELCARRVGRDGVADFDLSRWRVAGVGGEMVRADALHRFAELFRPAGFDAAAFVPSYGLAEATLAVTFSRLGQGVLVDTVDREQIESASRAVASSDDDAAAGRGVRSFVGCGRVLPGYRLAIRDDHDAALPDRAIGRVCVAGPSLMEGYFGRPDMTGRVRLADGWLDTGDMGYLIDGELVITGRRKDLIICNGRNIWPQDIEWAVEQISEIKTGGAAAFSKTDGDGERVVLVIECYATEADRRAKLVQDVTAVIQRTAGVHPDVVLVGPRTLPHTSSGKLSRAAAKRQFEAGTLAVLAVPAPAAGGPEAGG